MINFGVDYRVNTIDTYKYVPIKYVHPDKYVQAGGLFIVRFLRTEKTADPTEK